MPHAQTHSLSINRYVCLQPSFPSIQPSGHTPLPAKLSSSGGPRCGRWASSRLPLNFFLIY